MNCANRDIDHLIRALQLRDLRSFLHSDTQHLSLTLTGMSTTLSTQEYDELQLWELDCLLHCTRELAGPARQTSNTLPMNCNWRISMVFRTGKTKGNCICATTEMSTTLTTRTAQLALHNNLHVKPGPKAAPEGISTENYLSLHAKQEYQPLSMN